ncbi:TBC1 domain family member 22B-like [Dendronephthya gigantea]|uniref:TBC1 domain family member 22B-like n=1 Tax=Dendronephthya gigantea TaxID=151771 RepID=UPI001068F8C0|nr:TBC1 domain family member 22B-like [Dendronephthya gigantea]
MSDAAKNRVLVLGAQFNSAEKSASFPSQEKKSFWKRNTNKLPGSIKAVHSKSQDQPVSPSSSGSPSPPGNSVLSNTDKMRGKTQSFDDFSSKTHDAWCEDDDDVEKVGERVGSVIIQEPSVKIIRGGDVRSGILSRIKKKNTQANDVKPKTTSSSSNRECTVQAKPLPLPPHAEIQLELQEQEMLKLERFGKILAGPNTDLVILRQYSWSGIPAQVRPTTWQLLSGYLPVNIDRRQSVLDRKRQEYYNLLKQYYNTRHEDIHQDTFRQIHIDIPRTNPLIPLFQQPAVQETFERILYIWAIRHPASGYVQGINDLVTPFFVVFLSAFTDGELETYDVSKLSKDALNTIEADSFWCLGKLLDGIQDNYTFAQPGIQHKIHALKDLIQRVDAPLHDHLVKHNVEYLQFSFRWMNNLLMRELPLRCTIRLWDTYLSEAEGFAKFHLYVCAAFLMKYSKRIQEETDFQSLLILLQNLPTGNWGYKDVELLVAEAFKLKCFFAEAPKHLQSK